MSYTQIRYDVEGPVALLTLHRPEKMNAFTRTMMAEIIDAMDEAARPRQSVDRMETDGRSLQRVFVSALDGSGLPELRALLSDAAAPRKAPPSTEPSGTFADEGNPAA